MNIRVEMNNPYQVMRRPVRNELDLMEAQRQGMFNVLKRTANTEESVLEKHLDAHNM